MLTRIKITESVQEKSGITFIDRECSNGCSIVKALIAILLFVALLRDKSISELRKKQMLEPDWLIFFL